jgi:copper(I)-binding protein
MRYAATMKTAALRLSLVAASVTALLVAEASARAPSRLEAPQTALIRVAASDDANTIKAGDLTIAALWTRATPRGAKVAGGYLKISNAGTAPDRLFGGTAMLAGRIEVHEMSMSDGIMRMRPVKNGLEIKPGESVELSPGGYHLMLMDLKQQLREGDTLSATLRFEKAGTVEVNFRVGSIGEGAGH